MMALAPKFYKSDDFGNYFDNVRLKTCSSLSLSSVQRAEEDALQDKMKFSVNLRTFV
jgi:hypothetical protein